MSAGRALLTGATGLIGRQAIEPLQEAGFDVVALTWDDAEIPAGAFSYKHLGAHETRRSI